MERHLSHPRNSDTQELTIPSLTAHEIVLFATNTGELYEAHKQMARDNVPFGKWVEHINARVMPLYCRQVERATLLPSERFNAAHDLKDYYARHIRE